MPVATPQSLPEFAKRVAVVLALVTLALFLWKIAPVLMLAFAGIVAAVIPGGPFLLDRHLSRLDARR